MLFILFLLYFSLKCENFSEISSSFFCHDFLTRMDLLFSGDKSEWLLCKLIRKFLAYMVPWIFISWLDT